ncbi:MAG: tetratricopeptide repeat protein [Bauldia sp.]
MPRFGLAAALGAALLLAAPAAFAQDPDFAATTALIAEGRAAEAVPALTQLAEAGNAEAQLRLGMLYIEGNGVERNVEEGVRLVRLAAEAGLAEGQQELGTIYFRGTGVERDPVQAVEWYRLAAAQNYVFAQYSLGQRYAAGEGVPQDFAEALRWFTLAREQGLTAATYQIGILYANGDGVIRDFARATELMREAADDLYVAAMYNLGIAYAAGQGVPADPVESFKWFYVAYYISQQEPGGPIYEAVRDAARYLSPAEGEAAQRAGDAFILERLAAGAELPPDIPPPAAP